MLAIAAALLTESECVAYWPRATSVKLNREHGAVGRWQAAVTKVKVNSVSALAPTTSRKTLSLPSRVGELAARSCATVRLASRGGLKRVLTVHFTGVSGSLALDP